MKDTLVSVVIPFFNEEETIDLMRDRMEKVLSSLLCSIELILVDDGSVDDTVERLSEWQEVNPNVVIVKLSRNWGHQNAFNAGLDVARGDAIVFMDGDLEDPPEIIPELIEHWSAGFHTVYARKLSRHQRGLKKVLTSFYYFLTEKLNKNGVKPGSGMFSLVDKKVAVVLREMKESNKSYPNLRSFAGFKQKEIMYDRERRLFGKPKQSLSRLITDGLNALFSNTYVPIRAFSFLGLFFTTFFIAIGLIVLAVRLSGVEFWIFRDIPGTQLILLTVLAFGSIQIMFLGILGEYIARIYDESKGRPYYVIEEIKRTEPSPHTK